MRLTPSTCATVAVTPTAVVVSSSGAPWLVGVVHCGTRGVLLALVDERKDAWRAFGSAAASCYGGGFGFSCGGGFGFSCCYCGGGGGGLFGSCGGGGGGGCLSYRLWLCAHE